MQGLFVFERALGEPCVPLRIERRAALAICDIIKVI